MLAFDQRSRGHLARFASSALGRSRTVENVFNTCGDIVTELSGGFQLVSTPRPRNAQQVSITGPSNQEACSYPRPPREEYLPNFSLNERTE